MNVRTEVHWDPKGSIELVDLSEFVTLDFFSKEHRLVIFVPPEDYIAFADALREQMDKLYKIVREGDREQV